MTTNSHKETQKAQKKSFVPSVLSCGHQNSSVGTRRAFILNGVKVGTLVALFPSAVGTVGAACSSAYGSGLYGRGCYAGTIPGLLQLPPVQGNIQQDGFRFFLQGEPNRTYEIQRSADLTNWTSIGTLTMPANGSPMEILDSQTATAERQFYRADPL